MFSPSRPGPWIQSHQRSPLSIICKKSASMSRAAIFYLVGLLAVGGCREDAVVAPRVRVPSGALTDGSVSGPRVASGYVAVDLGVLLPNVQSIARAINNYRQIVIVAGPSSYLWQNGTMTLIGSPGTYFHAAAISDNGSVVGDIIVGNSGHAALWNGSTIIDLGTLGGSNSSARGVNDAGQVVGLSYVPGLSEQHAFVWQNGVMTDLGGFGGTYHGYMNLANGINASGQIVGRADRLVGGWGPFLWETGVMSDLGDSSEAAEAFAINTAGVVVGEKHIGNAFFGATMWQNGVTTLLGVLPGDTDSRATAINNLGQVVGISSPYRIDFSNNGKGFLWENGVMTALPDFGGGGVGRVVGINDAGDIVGFLYSYSDGRVHAVLWTKNPPNRPPTASAGGPYPGSEGSAIVFDGAATTDPDAQPLTYDWDFGDGSAHGTGVAPSHTYADNGSVPITLIVSDGALSDTATTTATVANAPPVPDAGLDRTVVVGRSTAVVPPCSDAGAADGPWPYTVRWGDGTANASRSSAAQGAQPSLSHTYAAAGTFIRRLTVTDKDGGVAFDEATITVDANQPPVSGVNGPYTGNEGAAVAVSSAGSTDPNADVLTYSWKFGDGGTSTAANPSHTYKDNGTYTVTLTVKDPSGATNAATTTATIANVAPTATLGAPSTITEGTTATVALTGGTDKGATDRATLEYAFDCGQGAGLTAWSTTVRSVICPAFPNQRAPVTVMGQIRDKDGGLTSYQKTMTVTNAAPVVTLVATSATTFPVGGQLGVQGSFSDKGAGDAPWATKIVWGDGTAATTGSVGAMGALPPALHVYATAGTYKVQLTVTDKDGKAGLSTRITVVVTP